MGGGISITDSSACIEVAIKKMSTKKTMSTIDVMSIKSFGRFIAGGSRSAL
jgi:hypothetical protein